MILSERTVGILIDRAALWSHGDLTTLLMRSGVSKGDPGQRDGVNRVRRAAAALQRAMNDKNERGLLDLTHNLLNTPRPAEETDAWVVELTAALRADGYLLVREVETEPGGVPWMPPTTRITWLISMLGGDELPLAPQVGSVTRDLKANGLTTAANHFEQANRSFASNDLEASNSQLRATFESVLLEIAAVTANWTGTSGGQAINVIDGKGLFEMGELDYVRGLWQISHKNGSHPGLSNNNEALFRFSAVTALCQYLIHRFL